MPDVTMFRNKKGMDKVLEVVLVAAILLILGWVLIKGVIMDKIVKGGDAMIPGCNLPHQKCACFFKPIPPSTVSVCPKIGEITTEPDYNSPFCPPDNTPCTAENYNEELGKGKEVDKDKREKWHGTCCKGNMAKVSDSRYHEQKK